MYFKQAIALMKQNKLFSGIYIFGTSLAIATTTIMAVLLYVKIAPLYPEYNRDNTYYVKRIQLTKGNRLMQSGVSYWLVKNWFYKLKNTKLVSAECAYGGNSMVTPERGGKRFEVKVRAVDLSFFRIYSLRFIEGNLFTRNDFESGLDKVVISDVTAEKAFGTSSNVVGKDITLDFKKYKVCGVYEEPSKIMQDSYAGIMMPYTAKTVGHNFAMNGNTYIGNFTITILCENNAQADAMRVELKELERKYNSAATDADWNIDLMHYPVSNVQKIAANGSEVFSWKRFIGICGFVLLVLLLIPALNLSGIISSRMEIRNMELGIRKAFGATRKSLLNQVLWENFFLTVLGGILGFILTVMILWLCRDWIFSLLYPDITKSGIRLTTEMLFSPVVFVFSFLVCIVLNLMSVFIPAWNALRRPIVDSLNVDK